MPSTDKILLYFLLHHWMVFQEKTYPLSAQYNLKFVIDLDLVPKVSTRTGCSLSCYRFVFLNVSGLTFHPRHLTQRQIFVQTKTGAVYSRNKPPV